jgi:Zn-dependent peptidase ImmA (M78 family)
VEESAAEFAQRLAQESSRQQAQREGILVSDMAIGNWEMQAGDPAAFSFMVGFARNPHGDDDRAALEERASWGYFSIWAGGENLCAHVEQAETLDAAHWYMLPLIEWFVENWDALLHEERPPLQNAGASAAESLMRTKMPPLSLKEVDEFQWLDKWADWWHRHSVRASRTGGVFPDVYIRRYRDELEVSTGAEALLDVPKDVFFLTPRRAHYVDPISAANSFFIVLNAALRELHRRVPDSDRLAQMLARLQDLTSPERRLRRMAWVAGLGDDAERYARITAEVDAVLAPVQPEIRQELEGSGRSSELVVYGSPYARLLYGAMSPSTTEEDVARLAHVLVGNYVPDASSWLEALESVDLRALGRQVQLLTPGEQGSWLGELTTRLLAAQADGWVDVHSALSSLLVEISRIDLSDDQVRAVSVFGPTQKPHIFCNRLTLWGQSNEVERFTLAHELCHLFLDREWGDALAVASGPWAPMAIEQRANAFAAAFLMPSWLLRDAITALDRPIDDAETIVALARRLRVSVSSLVDRLYNLGEITVDDRFRLRTPGFESR